MANQLKMALIDTIQRLHQENRSQRRIALELEADREKVSRYLLASTSKLYTDWTRISKRV